MVVAFTLSLKTGAHHVCGTCWWIKCVARAGPKSNEVLLLAYGFAIPDNAHDAYALRLTLSLAPPGSGCTSVTLGLDY